MKESPETDPDSTGEPPLARWLSLPGRILLLISVVGWFGSSVAYLTETLPGFPSGRYPLLLWFVPTGIAAFVFFGITAMILERLGVRIYKQNGD